MNKKQVALGYVRLSQTFSNSDRYSVEQQKANIEKVCRANNWALELYQDKDKQESDTAIKKRLEWQRLEARLLDDDVVALVANDMQTIHRKMWRVGELINRLSKNNTLLIWANENKEVDFSDNTEIAKIYLLSWFEEQYAEDARKRPSSGGRRGHGRS